MTRRGSEAGNQSTNLKCDFHGISRTSSSKRHATKVMEENEDVDPELAALEPWLNEMHLSVFDVIANAQAVTNEAGSNEGNIVSEHKRYRALQQAFLKIVHTGEFSNHVLAPLILRTLRIERGRPVLPIHLAQIWAAATCTLTYFKILNAIPASLLEDETVAGEIRNKSKLHMAQWQTLLEDV